MPAYFLLLIFCQITVQSTTEFQVIACSPSIFMSPATLHYVHNKISCAQCVAAQVRSALRVFLRMRVRKLRKNNKHENYQRTTMMTSDYIQPPMHMSSDVPVVVIVSSWCHQVLQLHLSFSYFEIYYHYPTTTKPKELGES